MRFPAIIALILYFLVCSCSEQIKFQAPLINNDYNKLCSNKELILFLKKADELSDIIEIVDIDTIHDNLMIPSVLITDYTIDNAKKLRIMYIGQQHGNEPSGKEALLMFISEIVTGNHKQLLNEIELLIIPQVNPYGGDTDKRRNREDIDLNRDHLLLKAEETQFVQSCFDEFDPHVFVDIHEYYPFGKSWQEFGYIKNFDIQLGGPTNINIDSRIRELYKNSALPFVKAEIEKTGFTFFEYTLGGLPAGERLRHSTVDINDGRQSTGITNILSFIVEGKNGEDSIDNIKRRAESQLKTVHALNKYVLRNKDQIIQIVTNAKEKLQSNLADNEVAIRMEHVSDSTVLDYPLRSIYTGNDTVF
jgi:hypothetical protein